MKALFACVFLLASMPSRAQELSWHFGSCVLSDSSVVTGDFSVDAFRDVVLYRTPTKQTQVLAAHRVRRLFFKDAAAGLFRKVISLKSNEPGSRWSLYEIVISGPVSIYRKPNNTGALAELNDRYNFSYFVQSESQLTDIRDFAHKVYPAMRDLPAVADFVSINKLDIHSPADAIRIIQFFNRSATPVILSPRQTS